MSSWEDASAVVLDNGSGMVKAGFAGQDTPSVVFPALVSRRKGGGDPLIGDDADKGICLKYPVEHGIVNDWEAMELVWRQAYKELEVEPKDQAVLVTEAPLNPKKNREKMLEVLFEEFEVPAMYVQIQAVLTLYSSSRHEGIVVDCGDGVSHTVPVYDGRIIPQAVRRMDIAGRDLTAWMQKLLNTDQEREFSTTSDLELVRLIKEKTCYLAESSEEFDSLLEKMEDDPSVHDEDFTLPDGETIKVGRARFCCPELLFNPALDSGGDDQGLHHVTFQSIQQCGIDCRKSLLSNIVLSGGSTLFRGMEARLTHEVKQLAPMGARSHVQVVSDSSEEGRGIRKYSVWMGGAILAGLSTFADKWILKKEYDDFGANIVHKRCDSLSGLL